MKSADATTEIIYTIMDNWILNSTSNVPQEDFLFSFAAKVALTAVISVVAAVGLFGNAVVVFIVFRYRDMHTVINYSFANLALTDLTMMLLDAVPTAADTMGTNFSANLGCSIPIYLQYISAEVTSLTLAFLSYDRYRLIVHPIRTLHRRTPKTLLKIFLCIWLVSFIVQVPTICVAGLTMDGECSEYRPDLPDWGKKYYFSYFAASVFCLPSVIIVVCYVSMSRHMLAAGAGPLSSVAEATHRRRRSVHIILLIIVLYFICWAPVHGVHLWMAFDPGVGPNSPLYIELHTAANALVFLNSSVNPFVYTLIGPSFRHHIKMMAMSVTKRRPSPKLALANIKFNNQRNPKPDIREIAPLGAPAQHATF